MKQLPIILILVGVALLAFWGYQYSENHQSAGIGDLKMTVSQSTSPVLAILGGASLLGGIGMMVRSRK